MVNMDLLKVVKQIATNYGESALSDPRRVSAFLSDLARDVPKPQKNALIKCLEHNFVQILQNADKAERANCKHKLAEKLHNEEGLDIGLCGNTIELLAIVLYGEENPAARAEQSKAIIVQSEEMDFNLTDLTKKTLTRSSKAYFGKMVLLKNMKSGQRKCEPFVNLPRNEEDINNFLNEGWVMDYTDSDLRGLKRFKRIAKDKDIYLGYKIKIDYIHLYLNGQSLGCLKRDIYEPTTIVYNGTKYNQNEPKVFWNDPVLDGLIAAVISKCSRWR